MLATLIGQSLSAVAAGAVGGGEGAAYGAANYQFNYPNDKQFLQLISMKVACDGGVSSACAIATNLEALDSSTNKLLTDRCQADIISDACISDRQALGAAIHSIGVLTIDPTDPVGQMLSSYYDQLQALQGDPT